MHTQFAIADVRDAAARLTGVAVRSPLVALRDRRSDRAADIHVKLETFQPIGSFKIRGVFNAVAQLAPTARARGISTTSAGNTAQALAWCGRHFGVPARAIMPDTAPPSKIRAVEALGGEIVLRPRSELFEYMKARRWEREPFAFIHPWTNRDVMVGHATMAIEIIEQCPSIETVFIPVGGGGLLGGVGTALKQLRPEIRIVAVEPQQCAAFSASREAGRAVASPCDTICDGVAVPYMTDEMFPILDAATDALHLVSEADVKRTIRLLALDNKVIAEGAGALATAAALDTPRQRRGASVAVVSGGSIEPALLCEIIQSSDWSDSREG